jgi:predicted dehydrogenase
VFVTRRKFIGLTSAATATIAAGIKAQTASRRIDPNEKLNIGIIGAGGKGMENINGVSSENIVAVCDVDDNRAAEAYKRLPDAVRYRDYRRMLEEEKSLDAVIVTTPDHHHAPAALMAMKLGKHVYCEKPLTHSIDEVRQMRRVAREQKVATQMGNQGHSFDDTRRLVEIVQAGVLGEVRQVHVWTDRPIWPQGMDRPVEEQTPPPHLDWELWLGPAPKRPYHSSYLPFNWRGWWDFGTGALGDMGCHNIDPAFWALKLEYPQSIEAESSGINSETAPKWSIIRYKYPARGELPPVDLTWYDGGKLPPESAVPVGVDPQKLPKNGCLIVGSKGAIAFKDWNPKGFVLHPQEQFKDFIDPTPTLPRSPGHSKEWIAACKGGAEALSNFDYAALLTETCLLGNLALRVGKRIDWDSKKMAARNCPEAEAFIRRQYRDWSTSPL